MNALIKWDYIPYTDIVVEWPLSDKLEAPEASPSNFRTSVDKKRINRFSETYVNFIACFHFQFSKKSYWTINQQLFNHLLKQHCKNKINRKKVFNQWTIFISNYYLQIRKNKIHNLYVICYCLQVNLQRDTWHCRQVTSKEGQMLPHAPVSSSWSGSACRSAAAALGDVVVDVGIYMEAPFAGTYPDWESSDKESKSDTTQLRNYVKKTTIFQYKTNHIW